MFIYVYLWCVSVYVCVKNTSTVGRILHLTNDLMKDLAIMIVHLKKEKQDNFYLCQTEN